jgi:hypothetical protein
MLFENVAVLTTASNRRIHNSRCPEKLISLPPFERIIFPWLETHDFQFSLGWNHFSVSYRF